MTIRSANDDARDLIRHTIELQNPTSRPPRPPVNPPQHVDVTVQSFGLRTYVFRLKKCNPLKNMMRAYCRKSGLSIYTASFTYEGIMIKEEDTPQLLGLSDGDIIQVFEL